MPITRTAAIGLAICVAVAAGACSGGGGPRNLSPVADAGADRTAREGEVLILSGRGSDTDGTVVTFDWRQVSGPSVALRPLADDRSVEFTVPAIDADAAASFELRVTDNAGATDTDRVNVSFLANFTLSGRVVAATGIDHDSDVNDPSATLARNNDFATAQPLANPVLLGGFANVPRAGSPFGQLTRDGDVFDVYSIDAVADQNITLFIESQRPALNDLDLALFDEDGTLVDVSLSVSSLEQLVVPDDGRYFVQVNAFSGASSYVLSIGQSGGAEPLQAVDSLVLSHDFVPGQAIVRFDERRLDEKGGIAVLGKQSGLVARGGDAGRGRLLDTRTYRAAGETASMTERMKAFARIDVGAIDGERRARLETLLAIKALRLRDDVQSASPNYRRQISLEPADEFFALQWHYPAINLPAAWDLTQGSGEVVVAVIDTGVLLDHPDLRDKLTAGYDFIADPSNAIDGDGIDPDPDDPGDQSRSGGTSSFHGTHVAGTVGAFTDTTTGVAGAGWNVRIMPLRALGRFGGSEFDINQAIRYAAGLANDSGQLPVQRADVINLSLGGPGASQSTQTLIDEVRAAGVVVVAAAGNSATSAPSFPAAYDGVISVSAVDINRNLAGYSNFGPTIDLAAPGGSTSTDVNGDGFGDGVLSTIGDDSEAGSIRFTYGFLQGTSMAAPHVAGVIGLMKSLFPAMTPATLDDLILSGALSEDLGAPGRDDAYGVGLIDAFAAVLTALDAAGGELPAPTPVLLARPGALNFGLTLTSQTITISNGGTGDLRVEPPVVDPAATWLAVEAAETDASGAGQYLFQVDRTGLDAGTLQTDVVFTSNAGELSVPVIMQVSVDGQPGGNAGNQFVLLVDALSGEVVAQSEPGTVIDAVPFAFVDVPPGEYIIVGGSDMDADGFICDAAEACGAFPVLDPLTLQTIAIDGARDDLDFTSTYSGELASGADAQRLGGDNGVDVQATLRDAMGEQGLALLRTGGTAVSPGSTEGRLRQRRPN
jgi:serine protease